MSVCHGVVMLVRAVAQARDGYAAEDRGAAGGAAWPDHSG